MANNLADGRNGKGRYVLLVGKHRSRDDTKAENLLSSLIKELKLPVELEVLENTFSKTRTPCLYAEYDAFRGINQIVAFVEQEKRLSG